MKRTIIPFLEYTSIKIISNTDYLSLIPGTKYVHTIQENKRKRTTEMSTTKKRIPLRMIQNSMNIPCLNTDNTFGKRKVKKRTILPTIILPLPLNKKVYTKAEIITILSPYKDRSPTKVKLMDEILTKKLVPAGRSQLFNLLKDHKEGKQIIDNDWNSRG